MPTITRRRIMLSTVAGAPGARIGTGIPRPVAAQAVPTGLIGKAGHDRFQIGDISAAVLSDRVIGGPLAV